MKRSLRRLLPFWERFAGFSRVSFLCRHFSLVNSFAQFAKFVKFGNLDKIRLSLIEDDSQRATTNMGVGELRILLRCSPTLNTGRIWPELTPFSERCHEYGELGGFSAANRSPFTDHSSLFHFPAAEIRGAYLVIVR